MHYHIQFFMFNRESIVEESKEIITADSAATVHSTHTAATTTTRPETNLSVAVATSEIQLSVRERWRIPVVFAKITRSKRLTRGDARIWKVVASNLLVEADMHERLAIANRESASLCADFAARVYIRMPAMSPGLATAKSFVRPPPIDTSPVAHGRQYSTHPHSRAPSAQVSPRISPKPTADRFTHPEPTHHGSFKFGIDALTSSLSRGLLSFGSNLDTKNKQYRAAAAADLDGHGAQQPQNTPTGLGLMKHHNKDFDHNNMHGSSSTAGMDTPTSHASASLLHRRSVGASPRRHSRGTPRAGGLRSPLMNHNHSTPRGGASKTPSHQQVPASPMALGRDHQLTLGVVGVVEDSKHSKHDKHDHSHSSSPDKQREWFAVSLSRKLAGLVGGAPAALASFTSSGSGKRNKVACGDDNDNDEPDGGSVGADMAEQDANDVSFGQASSNGNNFENDNVGGNAEDLERADKSCIGEAHSGGFGSGIKHRDSLCPSPRSRPGTMIANNTSTTNTGNTPCSTPSKPSSGLGGALNNIINNLSGKHSKSKPKRSPTHTIHTTPTHSKTSTAPSKIAHNKHTDSAATTPTSPAEGPVQKFFQLITLRGRNVVIRPAVTIKHDTVVQFY